MTSRSLSIILASLLAGALVLLWIQYGRGEGTGVQLQAAQKLHASDSLTHQADLERIHADSSDFHARLLGAIADSLSHADTIIQNWYEHERAQLPTADALRIKRIVLWRNDRPE